MSKIVCPDCGAAHELWEMEPSYRWPDAYLAVPPPERAERTIAGRDYCGVRDADDESRQYFLRALLPIPVRGEATPCSWGVWVEVSEAAFARARDLWSDPGQSREPPFAGALANALAGYAETLGLPGAVQLTGPTSVPRFTLAPAVAHPLAAEQREGVYPERVVQWLARHCAH
jgi:hypothetical protein